jgi:hypothetical protein
MTSHSEAVAYKVDDVDTILVDICKERIRQDKLLAQGKFPWSCDDIAISDVKKLGVLAEEFGEAAKEAAQIEEQFDRLSMGRQTLTTSDFQTHIRERRKKLREELVQVAAVAVAWCEALDKQTKEG